MIRTIEVTGDSGKVYTCVAPTLLPGRQLTHVYVDYFPHGDIDGWFSHNEQWQKKAIQAMWGEECVVSGSVPADTHEIINQGMGERKITLVPWNMIRLNHSAHVQLVHSYKWHVVHWDPLAWPRQLSLVVMDQAGKLVPCWYNKPPMERERMRGYR